MAFNLFTRKTQRDQAAAPMVQQPQQPVQPITPPADGNYIGWMNEMLGPTPAEREAQERKIAENKAKMSGWLGLFQGLGALGDLYYSTKGVKPSKPDYSAQATLEKNAANDKQRLDNLYKNRQAYANMLFNLQKQAGDNARKDKLADAQIKWYDTRDEMARLKGENDRLKAEQQIATNKARQEQIEAKTKQLQEMHPLNVEKMKANIKKILHDAGRPYRTSSSGGGRGTSSTDDYRELAENIENNIDITGPILQQQGQGFYDKESGQFIFTNKNTTKGVAREVNRRTAIQRNRRDSSNPSSRNGNNTTNGNKKKVNW